MNKLAIWGGLAISKVDGPGRRAVIHTAGCSIGCPGCFNPHTHDVTKPGVSFVSAYDFAFEVAKFVEVNGLDGLTISGGEPTDQMDALVEFLRVVRWEGVDSIVMFSGRRRAWLEKHRTMWAEIVDCELIDVLIDGPFDRNRLAAAGLRGSENQEIHMITSQHEQSDFNMRGVEIQIDSTGNVIVLGFPEQEMLNELVGGAA